MLLESAALLHQHTADVYEAVEVAEEAQPKAGIEAVAQDAQLVAFTIVPRLTQGTLYQNQIGYS